VLFGVGLRVISKWVWKLWRRERAFRAAAGTPIAVAICVLLLIPAVLAYPQRSDFTVERTDALKVPGSPELQAFEFLRNHVGPRDVVVAADRDGATVVTPTGAKVVAIYDGFSNPYVDLVSRVAARDGMVASLASGDVATFRTLASQYGVTWVVLRQPAVFDESPAWQGTIQFEKSAGPLRIYRVAANQNAH
jgi:hypothetical protein